MALLAFTLGLQNKATTPPRRPAAAARRIIGKFSKNSPDINTLTISSTRWYAIMYTHSANALRRSLQSHDNPNHHISRERSNTPFPQGMRRHVMIPNWDSRWVTGVDHHKYKCCMVN